MRCLGEDIFEGTAEMSGRHPDGSRQRTDVEVVLEVPVHGVTSPEHEAVTRLSW